MMKELKDERSKNELKRHACNCVLTSHLLLFLLSDKFRCSAELILKCHGAVEL